MPTDKREIERVQAIHKQADEYLANIERCWTKTEKFCFSKANLSVSLWWTRAELLAWPDVKAKLVDALRRLPDIASAAPSATDGCVCTRLNGGPGDGSFVSSYARGLCLYREMLEPVAPARPPQDGLLMHHDAEDYMPGRLPNRAKAVGLDPPKPWDHEIYTGKMGGGTWPSLDDRIAAAKAEMDEPTSARKARLGARFDGRPGIDTDWPGGDERNEP